MRHNKNKSQLGYVNTFQLSISCLNKQSEVITKLFKLMNCKLVSDPFLRIQKKASLKQFQGTRRRLLIKSGTHLLEKLMKLKFSKNCQIAYHKIRQVHMSVTLETMPSAASSCFLTPQSTRKRSTKSQLHFPHLIRREQKQLRLLGKHEINQIDLLLLLIVMLIMKLFKQ